LFLTRGITELPRRLNESVRFHPRCPFAGERHPALIALMVSVHTNEPAGIIRTALTDDAKKLDRKMLGRKGVVKLTPDDEVELGLTIGEGIETALAGMQLGYAPAWSCADAGTLKTFPVLSGIDCLTILVDADDAGRRAAAACAERWLDAGVEVFEVEPKSDGTDAADIVRGQ
jgi:putative DNA primase/helicase